MNFPDLAHALQSGGMGPQNIGDSIVAALMAGQGPGTQGGNPAYAPIVAALGGGSGGFPQSPAAAPPDPNVGSTIDFGKAQPPAMAGDFIRYANQGATRNQPLKPELVKALSFLPQMGVTMEVFSGGQPGKGESGARVGSTRHDHGGAGDVFFYKDGRKLDWANPQDQPIFAEIVKRGKAAGLTGFGAGDGYMQPGSMHLGFGSPAVWGDGGSGANAPDWLMNAYNGSDGIDGGAGADRLGAPPVQPEMAAIAKALMSQTPEYDTPQAEITGPDGDYVPAPEGQMGPIGSGMDALGGGSAADRLADEPKKKADKPLTEGQSKDTVFATRAAGALPIIDRFGDALTSLPESLAGDLPFIGNYMKSEGYQQAEQAGDEFLQAILRKDTGAAITKEETAEYGRVFLPRPGDGPALLEQKKASRARALEAVKAGMPPQALLYMEKALAAVPPPAQPLPDDVTEEDIEYTMKLHGLTREQVLEKLSAP